jgi:hypothetical protein
MNSTAATAHPVREGLSVARADGVCRLIAKRANFALMFSSSALICAAGTTSAMAQNAPPASLLNPQPPQQIAPDPQFVGTTLFQAHTTTQPVPVTASTSLAPGSPLGASVQVALARKYRDEPQIAPTVHAAPQVPGSVVPPRSLFRPAPMPSMGQPTANPTYKADVVNEPMVDTSHLPLQMSSH